MRKSGQLPKQTFVKERVPRFLTLNRDACVFSQWRRKLPELSDKEVKKGFHGRHGGKAQRN